MNISENGIKNIQKHEGCKLKAYKDVVGKWTIGWGHTSGVKEGQVITQAQADELMKQDLKKFVDGVNKLLQTTVNQNQFDALVSFSYNCGLAALEQSSLLELVNKRNFDAAAEEFDRWVKGTVKGEKVVIPGLVNRRNTEKKLFTTPVEKEETVYLKTGSMPKSQAEAAAKELKDKYGWIVHIMPV